MKKFLFVTVLVCFPIFGMLACNSLNNSPASPFSATSPNNGGTSPSTPGSPQNTPTFTNTLPPGAPTYTFTYTPTKTHTPVPGAPTNTFTFTPTTPVSNNTNTYTFTPTWTWTHTPSISISGISPNPVTYAFPTTILINGSGFANGDNINYSGFLNTPTGYFVNSSQMSLVFPRGYLVGTSTCSVQITSSTTSSNTYDFIADVPVPNITSVTSSSGTNVVPEGTSVSVTINGSGFTYVNTLPNCYFAWGATSEGPASGSWVWANYVSPNKLTMTIYTYNYGVPDTWSVLVWNENNASSSSNTLSFSVP